MAEVKDRMEATVEHVEKAWQCQLRPMTKAYAITAADRVVATATIQVRGVPRATHSWLDVPLIEWAAAHYGAGLMSCPTLVIARFDDAVLFVDATKVGPTLPLCGADNLPRVRIQLNRMSPVTFESRW